MANHPLSTRRAPRSPSRPRVIGMDVHQDASAVASVAPAHGAKGMALGTRGTRPCDRAQRLRTRPAKATHVVCVDAAGPWGSWRSRELRTTGDNGWVVAPAVIA
jgi:hypothetical protein